MTKNKVLWAFPGLRHFEDDSNSRNLFFGRDKETKELTEKVIAEDITVLFGKSGNGKTSLINVGLKQSLRDMDYLPVYARIFNSDTLSPNQALYLAIEKEADLNNINLPDGWKKETLWETFYSLSTAGDGELPRLVIILDQFEELFTLMISRETERDVFIQQLADLARRRLPGELKDKYHEKLKKLKKGSPESVSIEKVLFGSASTSVRILIAVRDDYLALLDHLGKKIPQIFQSRYRLPAFTAEQARQAIINPPKQKVLGARAFIIEDTAVDFIVGFLESQPSGLGEGEKMIGLPQLQIVCRKLEEQMRLAGKKSIVPSDLGGKKGLQKLLTGFYKDNLREISFLKPGPGKKKISGLMGILRRIQPLHSPRLAVRQLCEDRLIVEGHRNARHEDEIVNELGVSYETLGILIANRLLQRNQTVTGAFYELSHDSLLSSVQSAGEWRKWFTISLKIVLLAVFVFVSVHWGLPYLRDRLILQGLDKELEALRKGETPVRVFQAKFTHAKKILNDPELLIKYREDLKGYFLMLYPPILDRSDSLLEVMKIMYPEDKLLMNRLADTLHQRKIAEIRLRYFKLVSPKIDGKLPSQEDLAKAEMLLDSAFYRTDKDVRLIELQMNLARRRGDSKLVNQLSNEITRQRKIASSQLFSAIQIKEPHQKQIEEASLEKEPVFTVVLKKNKILENATVLLNGGKMEYQTLSKKSPEKYRVGRVKIPSSLNKVGIEIKVKDFENNISVKFFEIDIISRGEEPAESGLIRELAESDQDELIQKNIKEIQTNQKEMLQNITVVEPTSDTVFVENSSDTSKFQVKFPITETLLNVRYLLNNREMALIHGKKDSLYAGSRDSLIAIQNNIYRAGEVLVLPDVDSIEVSLKALVDDAILASKTFQYEILAKAEMPEPVPPETTRPDTISTVHDAVPLPDSIRLVVKKQLRETAQKLPRTLAGDNTGSQSIQTVSIPIEERNIELKLFLNDKKMSLKTVNGKKRFTGSIVVPPYAETVEGKIKIIGPEGIEDDTTVVFNVNRFKSEQDIKKILQKYDLYCKADPEGVNSDYNNPDGNGTPNDYVLSEDGKTVHDRYTGRMWQQSGSKELLDYSQAKQYLDSLNIAGFAGYRDWRLPALWEAMSLMERIKVQNLYINPIFDSDQTLIWTADQKTPTLGWIAVYGVGWCEPLSLLLKYNVRAVRTERQQ